MRNTERQRHRQKEKQTPCGEPDEGLNPGILGSQPEPKADTQPLSHPGAWKMLNFKLSVRNDGNLRSLNSGAKKYSGVKYWFMLKT